MASYEGQCQCGTVQWSIPKDKVDFTSTCHCFNCQKQSGSNFGSTSFMVYTPKAVTFVGGDAIKAFKSKSERGKTTQRGFCGECGTPLFNHVSEGEPDEHYAIRTGAMGEAAKDLKIEKEIFMRSKLPWIPTVTDSPEQQFQTMPE